MNWWGWFLFSVNFAGSLITLTVYLVAIESTSEPDRSDIADIATGLLVGALIALFWPFVIAYRLLLAPLQSRIRDLEKQVGDLERQVGVR